MLTKHWTGGETNLGSSMFTAMGPQASDFTSLSLNFLRYKPGTLKLPTLLVVIGIKGNARKTAVEMVKFPEHFLTPGSGQLLWEMLAGFLVLWGFT